MITNVVFKTTDDYFIIWAIDKENDIVLNATKWHNDLFSLIQNKHETIPSFVKGKKFSEDICHMNPRVTKLFELPDEDTTIEHVRYLYPEEFV